MNAAKLKAFASEPAAFRDALRIDSNGKPVPFVRDPWQEQDFQAMDPAWLYATGRWTGVAPLRKAWLCRPRGHSKSLDLACMALWALCFAARPVHGVVGAGDQDQAGIIRSAARKLILLNAWLEESLDLQSWKIVNPRTDSYLEILSADAATSWGTFEPDFILLDEVSHWKSDGLWNSLFSACEKRATCLLVVITNAGYTLHFSADLHERFSEAPDWYQHKLRGPQASWITDKQLASQRRGLSDAVFNRVWLNQWQSGIDQAVFRAEDIAAVFEEGTAG